MFLGYTVLLVLSGITLIVLGAALEGQTKVTRVINILVGVGFLGYGLYLLLFFTGGSYRVFIYVFVLPILLVIQAFKARKARRQQAARAAAGQAGFGAPVQPSFGAPAQPGYPVPPSNDPTAPQHHG